MPNARNVGHSSARPWGAALIVVLLVGSSLVVALSLGLAMLAGLPGAVDTSPPTWSMLGPAMAVIVTSLSLLRCKVGLGPRDCPQHPASAAVLFFLTANAVAFVGAFVEQDPLAATRASAVYVGLPAIVAIHALVLDVTLLQLWQRHAQPASKAGRAGAIAPPGSRDISPSTTLAPSPARSRSGMSLRHTVPVQVGSLAAAALGLAAVFCDGHRLAAEEGAIDLQLENVARVIHAQAAQLPAWRVPELLASYPVDSRVMPLLLSRSGQVLATHAPGLDQQTTVVRRDSRCAAGGQRFRCALFSLGAAHSVGSLYLPDLLSHDGGVEAFGARYGALGFIALLGVLLIARAYGRSLARDLDGITAPLRNTGGLEQIDLGRPVAVTSIDELGDLAARIGKLRRVLDQERRGYRESLKQVRAAERIKNDFFAGVSESVRIPLTTIAGLTQLLLEGRGGPITPSQQGDLKSILRGGDQLLSLASDVIDLSAIESGHIRIVPTMVALDTLIAEAVAQERCAAASKNPAVPPVEVVVEIAPDLPLVHWDPVRMRQVLQNLLSNALKFTQRGQIVVRASVRTVDEATECNPLTSGGARRLLTIQVEDTGVGISAAELPLLFERYRQAGDMRQRKLGSGLGLAICRHLVALHGGTLEVDSQLGAGTCFTMHLPVAANAPRPALDVALGAVRSGAQQAARVSERTAGGRS